MRRFFVWSALAAVMGLAIAIGGFWAYQHFWARFQPVTITREQATIQRLLDESSWLSAGGGGEPLYIVGYRDSAAMQRYEREEAPKLRAAGVEVDPQATLGMEPVMTVDPAFGPLTAAARARRAVTFSYRVPEVDEPSTRRLQPWGVVCWQGRWYVVGHDTDRDGTRLFRLSRVHGTVVPAKKSGTYDVPPGTDLRAITETLAPPPADRSATVLVRSGAGHGLRRHAAPAPGDAPEGWDRLEVRYSSVGDLADELLWYGADVVAAEPPELREAVVTHLKELAA